jgi:hypothetical protein
MSAKPIYPVTDLGELIQISEEYLRKRRALWSSLKRAEPTQAEEEKLLVEAIENLRRGSPTGRSRQLFDKRPHCQELKGFPADDSLRRPVKVLNTRDLICPRSGTPGSFPWSRSALFPAWITSCRSRELGAFSFRTIKYWSGFAGDF